MTVEARHAGRKLGLILLSPFLIIILIIGLRVNYWIFSGNYPEGYHSMYYKDKK